MPLWRGGPNTRTLPTLLLTPSASKAADMAHLCVPQNQALGVCRGFVPDIQICGTHGRKNLVNATIISNAEAISSCHRMLRPHLPLTAMMQRAKDTRRLAGFPFRFQYLNVSASWAIDSVLRQDLRLKLFVGCLTSQQHASVSQGRI